MTVGMPITLGVPVPVPIALGMPVPVPMTLGMPVPVPIALGMPVPVPIALGMPVRVPIAIGMPVPVPIAIGMPVPVPIASGAPVPVPIGAPVPITFGLLGMSRMSISVSAAPPVVPIGCSTSPPVPTAWRRKALAGGSFLQGVAPRPKISFGGILPYFDQRSYRMRGRG
ncbi:hypothetical protein FN846DRAFT_74150 [Sphaerosporella brunnea]|uniref:Uncharacterized protein n=1 Tax=Sphaerosporella brunnea TaxID=1250544 RepID=A0A5J5ESP8_9PEZI|nr:hypothetical protein FN846DRAFT_74150 [Sphaerosporella brunnea]